MIATDFEFDSVEWLKMISQFEELSTTDLLGAYAVLGLKTCLTSEQLYWAAWHLERYGLVQVEELVPTLFERLTRRRRYNYTPLIPSALLTDAELEALEAEVR